MPIFEDFGFTPPSAGVIARDLSEKIEKAIIQHCESFSKGYRHCDLCRFDQDFYGVSGTWQYSVVANGTGSTRSQAIPVAGESFTLDEIVRKVGFPDWQSTSQGERLVQKELRRTLWKYRLHTDQDLFEKAYSYIRQYY